MAALETRLIIKGVDEAGPALDAVKNRVNALDKQLAGFTRSFANVDKVNKSVGAISQSLLSAGAAIKSVETASGRLRAEYERLSGAQTKLNAFKAQTDAFRQTREAFSLARGQVEQLARQMALSSAPTMKLTREYEGAQRAVHRAATAFEAQKVVLAEAKRQFEELDGPLNSVRSAEERLRGEIEATNAAIGAQGAIAMRSAEEFAAASRRQEEAARRRAAIMHAIGRDLLPFAGPAILEGAKGAFEAGATVQERVAQLQTAGATPAEIATTRGDWRDFSKTHAGVLESDWLASFKDARVIAPDEAYAMTGLGARYRSALRNSGISVSENDIGNTMQIMDELGLPSMEAREGFLDHFLRAQQAFGGQISTETALSAYRNAKQSIYDWSPEFRDKYFPTLLQSAGEQGGTEMMTSLSNYAGGHMQDKELRALAHAGFVGRNGLLFNKVGDVKGLKPDAQLFEADLFKSNIAQWAWDFHAEFMKRKGATEGAFGDLIDKMPRNMGGLIAFMVHNQARLGRDAATLDKPIGLAAGDNAALANNPIAGLAALKDAIEAFAGVVTAPAMQTIGKGLEVVAQGIQGIASAYGGFAKDHAGLAGWLGGGAMAGGLGLGGWLSIKLLSGLGSSLLGGGAMTGAATALGGSAAALDVAAGALDAAAARLGGGSVASNFVKGLPGVAPAAGGLWGFLGGGALAGAAGIAGGLIGGWEIARLGVAINEAMHSPQYNATNNRLATLVQQRADLDDEIAGRQAAGLDTGADRARHATLDASIHNLQVQLDPASRVAVDVTVRADDSGILKLIASAVSRAWGSVSASVGTSTAGIAPNGARGGWDR